jgi:Ion channel
VPGAAVLRGSYRYGLVLALVVAQLVLLSAGGNAAWVRVFAALLSAALLVLVYLTAGLRPRIRRAALGLATVAGIGAVASLGAAEETSRGVTALVSALLVLVVASTVVRGISLQAAVDLQTILAALSIYLMLGLFFTYVYAAIAAFGSDPFFAGRPDATISEILYFSYVTLATVGYGDFVAAASPGRTVALIEGMTGQLYLVTVVALIVGNLGRQMNRRGAA